MSQEVDHPSHYNTGKIEVIEFLEDQKLDFHCANAIKYICRAGRKDPQKFGQDLEKAIWYLKRRLEIEKTNPRRPNEMSCLHPELIRNNVDDPLEKTCVDCGIIVVR